MQDPGQHDIESHDGQDREDNHGNRDQCFMLSRKVEKIHNSDREAIDHVIENCQDKPYFEKMKQGRLDQLETLVERTWAGVGGTENPHMQQDVE